MTKKTTTYHKDGTYTKKTVYTDGSGARTRYSPAKSVIGSDRIVETESWGRRK